MRVPQEGSGRKEVDRYTVHSRVILHDAVSMSSLRSTLPLITDSSYACSIVATVLYQCGTTDYVSYYDWQIPINVFFRLSIWLLLVVFVWTLGTMLREQLRKLTIVYKTLFLAMVGLLGVLTCAQVGISSYNYWALGHYEDTKPHIQEGIRTACYILDMIVVFIAGGLALMTIMSLRTIRHPAGVRAK